MRVLTLAQVVILLRILTAGAQEVVAFDERLDPDRPEAWGMYYFTATSFMTGFGEAPEQVSGDARLAVE